MEQLKLIQTDDGSHTIYSEQYHAHYHSLRGALQESLHIFIENGYCFLAKPEVNILEVGFGTGLNAALTASKAEKIGRTTKYTGVELHPPSELILSEINYAEMLSQEDSLNWKKIAQAKWNNEIQINSFFSIKKIQDDFIKHNIGNLYDIIYFDAFAPDDQPEMWSESIFEKIYVSTNPGGILVTYCSKGIVKQALRKVGFRVERLAGPAGKRHILRAMRA